MAEQVEALEGSDIAVAGRDAARCIREAFAGADDAVSTIADVLIVAARAYVGYISTRDDSALVRRLYRRTEQTTAMELVAAALGDLTNESRLSTDDVIALSPGDVAAAEQETARRFVRASAAAGAQVDRCVHLLLSTGAKEVAPWPGRPPSSWATAAAWHASLLALAALRPSGVCFHGRTRFLTPAVLGRLLEEADDVRPIAQRTGLQRVGPVTPTAREVASREDVRRFVTGLAGPLRPGFLARLLYYVDPGGALDPHVDMDGYSMNCIIPLRHTVPVPATRRSALVIYDRFGAAQRFELEVGTMIIFHANGSAHAREPVAEGEDLTILNLRFDLAKATPQPAGGEVAVRVARGPCSPIAEDG